MKYSHWLKAFQGIIPSKHAEIHKEHYQANDKWKLSASVKWLILWIVYHRRSQVQGCYILLMYLRWKKCGIKCHQINILLMNEVTFPGLQSQILFYHFLQYSKIVRDNLKLANLIWQIKYPWAMESITYICTESRGISRIHWWDTVCANATVTWNTTVSTRRPSLERSLSECICTCRHWTDVSTNSTLCNQSEIIPINEWSVTLA